MFFNDDFGEFPFVEFVCNCCGKSTKVLGSMSSPLSYFYLVAHNRGFATYTDDITLCPNCNKVFKAIEEDFNRKNRKD